eukprot:TRINITY_DN5833_c0_g1_i1.p3 TRINITY_DN5833_c0_g1~~TRINITY_DN5833_c0_g1_i1.p3  ORF type:complete len:51 (-),score=4.63 TRINITY_DN5833_c0_g1_i1:17-169(-)
MDLRAKQTKQGWFVWLLRNFFGKARASATVFWVLLVSFLDTDLIEKASPS